jgi:hypothetical protein
LNAEAGDCSRTNLIDELVRISKCEWDGQEECTLPGKRENPSSFEGKEDGKLIDY